MIRIHVPCTNTHTMHRPRSVFRRSSCNVAQVPIPSPSRQQRQHLSLCTSAKARASGHTRTRHAKGVTRAIHPLHTHRAPSSAPSYVISRFPCSAIPGTLAGGYRACRVSEKAGFTSRPLSREQHQYFAWECRKGSCHVCANTCSSFESGGECGADPRATAHGKGTVEQRWSVFYFRRGVAVLMCLSVFLPRFLSAPSLPPFCIVCLQKVRRVRASCSIGMLLGLLVHVKLPAKLK